jgi:hypothetical protein
MLLRQVVWHLPRAQRTCIGGAQRQTRKIESFAVQVNDNDVAEMVQCGVEWLCCVARRSPIEAAALSLVRAQAPQTVQDVDTIDKR